MECFKQYMGDRICSLCKETNVKVWEECKLDYDNYILNCKIISDIEERCPYRKDSYDEYTPFYACCLDGRSPTRFSKECRATLECVNLWKLKAEKLY